MAKAVSKHRRWMQRNDSAQDHREDNAISEIVPLHAPFLLARTRTEVQRFLLAMRHEDVGTKKITSTIDVNGAKRAAGSCALFFRSFDRRT